MTDGLLDTLAWLPPAGPDFRPRLRALTSTAGTGARPQTGPVPGAALRDLATRALDLNKLVALDRAVSGLRARIDPGAALTPLRLALLAGATTAYVAPAIAATALRHGILAELYVPDYGQAMPEVLTQGSGLARFAPDVVLVSLDHRALGLTRSEVGPGRAPVAAALAQIAALVDGIRARLGATVIVETVAAPPDPWCGHFDRRAPGSLAAQIAALNDGIADLAARSDAVVLDTAALATLVGRARWFDPAQWHAAKLPFALDLVPLYADHVGRLLGALRGRARKCLVLDLDNTLWGGVIGDDGVEGIRLGQGSAEGEAHLAVQAYALELKKRGIVLAVCSKNELAAARLPFERHPEMLLGLQDIAVFVANWTDKATNLGAIAQALNIGTDALAFLDDNPAERARVRQMLPEVAVPELPADPAGYVSALSQAGYFETVGLSADDGARAEQYRANAERAQSMADLGDYDAYLTSLDMTCDLRPFDAVGRTRIAQLINKSNQFNLTTRRYTEAQVAAFEADPARFTLQVRLIDRFGDNGMISVLIFDRGPEVWACDTWLMSCRVLGRRVEEAALATVAAAARAAGAVRLTGTHVPSAKNAMVAGHFGKLGFRQTGEIDGVTTWALYLADWQAPDLPLRLTGLPATVTA